ncbi:hypothetical protein [Vreelandella subglaciescola]|jgi:hypothetical protein|uniref:Uncharacterized protein n=1 Tax=Vreelandella subglaciescola TaxID=29571 RepID=A0A1M7EJ02_9GAMM|nr:hypothetical protein [Halomonas subglaciescola]SHL91694.1 hypothetical protein SAMN05878437_0250 [Halomonas subglaciescola]
MTDGDNELKISGDSEDSLELADASAWTENTSDSTGNFTSYTAELDNQTATLEVQNTLVE